MLIFFQLLAAHLIADFILQTDAMGQGKRSSRVLLKHSAVHGFTAMVLINLGLSWSVGSSERLC